MPLVATVAERKAERQKYLDKVAAVEAREARRHSAEPHPAALAAIAKAEKKANTPRAPRKPFSSFQISVLQARHALVTRCKKSKPSTNEKRVLCERIGLTLTRMNRWMETNKKVKFSKTHDPEILNLLAEVKAEALRKPMSRNRIQLSDLQLQALEIRFGKDNYIDISEREALGKELGMSAAQIEGWFNRQRFTIRREQENEEEEEMDDF